MYVGTPAMEILLPLGIPLCATEVKQWSVNGPASVDDIVLGKKRSWKVGKSWGFRFASLCPTQFWETLHASSVGVPCKDRCYV